VRRTALDIFVVICFVMVFLAFVEFAFISFVGIFISRMKYRDFVRVRTLRQMTRYMYVHSFVQYLYIPLENNSIANLKKSVRQYRAGR
jgi:hypothetical protein